MQFLLVYIAEAHARDQWPVGKTISCVDQPLTLEQRLKNANQCRESFKFEMPMIVDNMDNTFHNTYGAWPFRFYIMYQNKLVFKAEPDADGYHYNLTDLDNLVENFYENKNSIN